MPEVQANGLTVDYATEGGGPPLIMLHAATSVGVRDWAAQRPQLRDHYTLFLPDARGHGRTRWDVDQGWAHAMLPDDVLAFADALGLERFHVAGLSMGGVTALALAMTVPERLITAMVAAAGIEAEPRSSVARRLMQPDALERDDPAWAARQAALHDPVQGPGGWKKLMAAVRDDIMTMAGPAPEDLRRARLPILLAYGDRDPWVPLEQAVRLRRQLPDASLFVSPGVGHLVVIERPAAFNQAYLQFLRLSSRHDG